MACDTKEKHHDVTMWLYHFPFIMMETNSAVLNARLDMEYTVMIEDAADWWVVKQNTSPPFHKHSTFCWKSMEMTRS